MRIAYADPPYPGQARRHYGRAEVDHGHLINHLCSNYPNGWALSTSSPALSSLLTICPPDIRIGAWVKPFAIFKPGVNPAYAWEPVIFRGGRKRDRSKPTVRDWVSANVTLKKGLVGAKPEAFCFWLFDLLGREQGDTFIDLFPGTGIVTQCWEMFIQ